VVSAEDRPVAVPDVVDAGARDSGPGPLYCVAHFVDCATNRDCDSCGATPEGVTFCCSTMTAKCLLRNVTRGCMP
jgi:hypothetical protein